MSEPNDEPLRIVYDAAALLVSTSPVEIAALLKDHGYDQAAEHIRFLGVAVSLCRVQGTADGAKVAPFYPLSS